jgi:hypothetical protein
MNAPAISLRPTQHRFFDFGDPEARRRSFILLGIFVWLVIWLWLWPYTGDGDSMLHYWNLRASAIEPKAGLTSWACPVYVLLMIAPASGGLVPVRVFTAFLAILLVWQTMRLADDLKFERATLAGWFLILQPLVFALASDTMTEIPMALGGALAIRSWLAKRYATSCLIMAFLPFVRPEGFLLAPVWGVMLLLLPYDHQRPSFSARIGIGSLLGAGVVCLVIACHWLADDWLYYIRVWSWPVGFINRGSLWHHVVYWPYYCGPVLLPLFLVGIKGALRRSMLLPWIVWGLVFFSHTIFFYFGMFSSYGLMRIMATTSPITALVCLEGWNTIANSARFARRTPRLQQFVTAIVLAFAAVSVMVFYYLTPEHHRCFVARQAGAFLKDHPALKAAPRFFVGDPMALESTDYPAVSEQLVANKFDRREQLELLAKLPVGSVGIWDNGHGFSWHHVRLEEFPALGYRALFTARRQVKYLNLLVTRLGVDPAYGDPSFIVVIKEK